MQMQDDMAEATRLTRSGRLAEATALIQRTLGRSAGEAVDSGAPAAPASDKFPHRGPAHRPGPDQAGRGPATGPATGRFLDASFTNRAGTRGYKLYVPTG